ncbi:MAG: helix-hairpin-helix domain-containing protein [Deltaproteobacteria bacterium]|nr:helix-hairpin-helix domain-containing protein [Deltaproteobacteria bacterium]
MRVSEGQRLGALTVLIASLFVYIGAFIHDRCPFPVFPLPWGDQKPGMIAVEVTGVRRADGVYFFPKATAVAELYKITGLEGKGENSGFAEAWRSAGAALSVTVADGKLKIVEMSSVTKLALGLPVDLNRATEEELSLVPGIGETLAQQIVQLRQQRRKFGGLEELTAVPGIKNRKLRILEKYLSVEPIP